MISLGLIAFVSFCVTFVTIPVLLKFAHQTQLYTKQNDRTCHTAHDIPSLGGVAIFMGITFSTLLLSPNREFGNLQYLLATQFAIFLLGLKDDIYVLSARTKLLIQILCALGLVTLAGTKISSFYGVLGVFELSPLESTMFTTIAIVGLINSFNLIDGINWLAGLMAISATSFLAYWFTINGFYLNAGISFAIIGSVGAFLYYNRTPAKIFMGDTGSLHLGLTITYLIIEFINLNHQSTGLNFQLRSAPPVAVALLLVPIIDTLQVIFIRLKNRRNPFSPDKNHLHHILLSTGISHMKASFILFIINCSAITGAVAFNQITGKIIIPLVFISCYTLINLIGFSFVKKRVERKIKLVA